MNKTQTIIKIIVKSDRKKKRNIDVPMSVGGADRCEIIDANVIKFYVVSLLEKKIVIKKLNNLLDNIILTQGT